MSLWRALLAKGMVRALIVTPTYRGTSLQLNATDKDGQAWRNYLLSRGVAADKIVWLTEATIAPTEAKILSEIDALVAPQAPT